MKVIVTDGNNRAALAITRSLGREGHEVIVGAEQQPCLASSSRFCKDRFTYPDPMKSPGLFIAKIQRMVENRKPDVLLPVSEITTIMITANKMVLERFCSIPFPSLQSVSRAANKFEVLRLAHELGIPTPRTDVLEKPGDIETMSSFFCSKSFPLVIKPSRSRVLTVNGWQATGVKYASNENELKTIIDNLSDKDYPLLLQERIYGSGVGLFACYNRGKLIAAFSHRRIREKPPSGGVSVLRESIPLNFHLKMQSEQLLKKLGWQGVAMVEFKLDSRAGDFKLMEVNGRFWGSLQLAIDAGVNFPSILVKMTAGEDLVPTMSYKIGVKTRWFWGDMDALMSRLFKKNTTLNLPSNIPGRFRSVIDFLKFWGKDLYYEILDNDDIKPWLFETRRWFLRK